MAQRFYANPQTRQSWPNGAIGYGPGGPFDCLGPFAKVVNCPVADSSGLRRTVYATNYADKFFSIPAECKISGKTVTGFLLLDDNGPEFVPYSNARNDALIEQSEQKRLIGLIRLAQRNPESAADILRAGSFIHSQTSRTMRGFAHDQRFVILSESACPLVNSAV